ncbi:hypothetical protein BH09VER1_BH09VER1_48690 [soil metagenome]
MLSDKNMPETYSRYPYDRTLEQILLRGGPIWFFILIFSVLLLLLLLLRRSLYTDPKEPTFYAADIFLLLLYLFLPVLFSLIAIPSGYLALKWGGIDSDWPLPMRMQEVMALTNFTLIGSLVLLMSSGVQFGVRRWRRASEGRSS